MRFGLAQLMLPISRDFPWATLGANILGCFLIGLAWQEADYQAWSPNFRAFFFTGLLGGFTTFSTFALESQQLWQTGQPRMMLLYVAGSVLVGLLAVFLGLQMAASLRS